MSTASNHRPPARLLLAAIGALGASAALTGCYTEGGVHGSIDRFTYVSRPHQPKTISLVDTRTYETVWTVDIPVGQKLALQFFPNKRVKEGETIDPNRPDVMRWQFMPEASIFGELHNQINVPPSNARRIEMKLRPGPEMPPTTPLIVPPATPPAYMDDSSNHPSTAPQGTPTTTAPAEPPVELPK